MVMGPMRKSRKHPGKVAPRQPKAPLTPYGHLLSGVVSLIEQARLAAVPLTSVSYVQLLSVTDPQAREYYEREALQGGWSVRQLDRQIATIAFQRIRSARSAPAKGETLPAGAHVRDPFLIIVDLN
jgi:hypothetical protein